MTYFVICNSDGDTTVSRMTAEELKKALNDKDWGENPEFITPDEKCDDDTNYWAGGMMIIKGEIIVPQAKQTITEYEV